MEDMNELASGWRSSAKSFSNGACVQCASHGAVVVRDSKSKDLVLEFSSQAWRTFMATLR